MTVQESYWHTISFPFSLSSRNSSWLVWYTCKMLLHGSKPEWLEEDFDLSSWICIKELSGVLRAYVCLFVCLFGAFFFLILEYVKFDIGKENKDTQTSDYAELERSEVSGSLLLNLSLRFNIIWPYPDGFPPAFVLEQSFESWYLM